MRQLMIVLVLVIACVVGVGFYRGWFAMSNTSSGSPSGNGDINVNLSTDRDKFDQDLQTIKDKASDITGDSEKQTTPR